MKLLIMSDSHGLTSNNEIVTYENCDAAFHLGDSQLMANQLEMSNYDIKVRGNCDFDRNYPEAEVITVGGVRFFLTHGHLYDVNYGLGRLKHEASENNCEVALYGHTHVVNVDTDDQIIALNPGSTRQSRSRYPETYMVMIINDDNFEVIVKNAKSFELIETYTIKR